MPLVAAVIVAAATAQAPALLSPVAFRDRVAAAIAAITGQATVALDERSLRATKADGTVLTVNTENAYAQYQADPAQADAIAARYARLLVGTTATAETVDQLVVIVRPTTYLVASLSPGASTANFVASRPMAGDLSYFLAVDSPETIRMAVPADLIRWRLNQAAAWTRAVANLKARMGALQIAHVGSDDGASVLTATSGLAPSMLADPAVCGPGAPTGVDGQLVFVVARDAFLFAIPADRLQTERFWAEARRQIADHAALSNTVLTCRAGRWTTVPVPPVAVR